MGEVDRNWLCPWCSTLALLPTQQRVICHSRTCQCGALALGAPRWDSDEIIDETIGAFGIADGYLTFDADRIAGLQLVGIEIAEGLPIPSGDGNPFELRVIWFRRKAEPAT
jgi:hypothetical protein